MTVSKSLAIRRPAVRTEAGFEKYKSILYEQYLSLNKSREAVARFMKERYGFEGTKSQYEKAFNTWGWSKNIPSKVWDVVCAHLRHREGCQFEYAVFYHAEKLKEWKIRQEMKRRPRCPHVTNQCTSLVVVTRRATDIVTANLPALPPGIAIISPPLDVFDKLIASFPFLEFEAHLTSTYETLYNTLPVRSNLRYPATVSDPTPLPGHLLPQNTLATTAHWPVPDNPASDHDKPKHSTAVSLLQYKKEHPPFYSIIGGMTSKSQLFLFREALYSIANNFAGSQISEAGQILGLLQFDKYDLLNRLLDHASNLYTTKALIHNLFQAAIETGDAKVIESILCHQETSIDVNTFVCNSKFGQRTPLQHAACLQHKDAVAMLLKYGAQLNSEEIFDLANETDEGTERRKDEKEKIFNVYKDSILDKVIWSNLRRTGAGKLDKDIFRTLCAADSTLNQASFKLLIKEREDDCLKMILAALSRTQYDDWCTSGCITELFESGDDVFCLECFMILSETGLNIDREIFVQNFKIYPDITDVYIEVIDYAAIRGLINLVQMLHRNDAPITETTVHYAVRSGVCELVRFVLQHFEFGHALDEWKAEVLTKALSLGRSGQDIVACLLLETPVVEKIGLQDFSASELYTALQTGDQNLIDHFVNRSFACGPALLQIALNHAIQEQSTEQVIKLLALGASPDGSPTIGNGQLRPLIKALDQRNTVLVKILLDAGADPGIGVREQNGETADALHLAIEWRNLDVIEQMFSAGSRWESNWLEIQQSTLLRAVEKADFELIEFLLGIGLDLNFTGDPFLGIILTSPLAASVTSGQIELVRYILDCGADPHDEDALLKAVKRKDGICDLILDRHRARYPAGSGILGWKALIYAIKSEDFALFTRLLGGKVNKIQPATWPHEDNRENPLTVAILAAANGDNRFLEEMLRKGYSPEATVAVKTREHMRGRRTTALIAAISTGNISIVRAFIKHNANVNLLSRLEIRRTPIQFAAEKGHLEIVQLLIHAGANVNAPPAWDGGGTAVQLAARGGYNKIIELLISHGADVNQWPAGDEGRTALEGAAEHGRLDTVAILLNAGAAPGESGKREIKRAIKHARRNGFTYICDMLENYLVTGQLSSVPTTDDLFRMYTCIDNDYDEMDFSDQRAFKIE